jgi:DnaJ like chaperone protein
MSWLFRSVGALLGLYLFRSPYGLLFGLAIGYCLDMARSATRSHEGGFIEPLFAFLGALAKADGRVSEAEIAATERTMARMGLDDGQRRAAIRRFNEGKQAGFAVNAAIYELKRWSQGRRDHAYILIDLVLDVLGSDGVPEPGELGLLRKLAWSLGVHEREWIAIAAMKGHAWAAGPADERHAPPPRGSTAAAPDPYAVLGVPREAGEREIKRAYRKLMSEHHPDKLGDVPAALRQHAEERAREINAAYERVKAARGFK